MKNIKLFITLTFTLALIWSCEKDEEDSETIVNIIESNDKATLNFEPSSASWFYREYPDSIIISIKNGLPPYIISQKSDNVQARINGDQLILYPFLTGGGNNTLHDFILIRDNAKNENTFNFSVKSLNVDFNFNNSNYSLSIFGSTDIDFNGPAYGTYTLDKFAKSLYANISETGQSFSFFINNVDKAGSYVLNENNVLVQEYFYVNYTDSLGYSRGMSLKDSNQVIHVSTYSDTLIELNFDLDLENEFWGVFYNYDAVGNIRMRK